MKKIVGILLAMALFSAGTLVAEGNKEAQTSGAEGKKYLIGVSQPTMTHPIRKAANDLIADWLTTHPDVEVMVTDGQLNANKQISDLEDMIAKDVDAILVAAHQSATLVPVLQQAKDAGIPIIAFDRSLTDTSVQVSQIINDDVQAGRTAAELLVEGMGETGKIAILEGAPGGSNTIMRQDGFMEEIKKYPGIEIVADLTANFQRVQAVEVFENIIQSHPDIKGVYCHNDEMALGVCKVLKDAGITGVVVVGIDGQKDALQSIMAGELYGTVRKIIEVPYALDYAYQYLTTGSCPDHLLLESAKINKDNVNDFYNPDAVF